MVMTRFGGSKRRKLLKGSYSSKGKTFDQERSAMDPIDVEPSAQPTTLVPYGTFEYETPTVEGFGEKESYTWRFKMPKVLTLKIIKFEQRHKWWVTTLKQRPILLVKGRILPSRNMATRIQILMNRYLVQKKKNNLCRFSG